MRRHGRTTRAGGGGVACRRRVRVEGGIRAAAGASAPNTQKGRCTLFARTNHTHLRGENGEGSKKPCPTVRSRPGASPLPRRGAGGQLKERRRPPPAAPPSATKERPSARGARARRPIEISQNLRAVRVKRFYAAGYHSGRSSASTGNTPPRPPPPAPPVIGESSNTGVPLRGHRRDERS